MKSYNVNAVVGVQWGDEGKGRIVDYLASDAELVIRFQGGDNAGHTVINDKGKFGLHILPSGIFNPDTMNIVGAGTVVNFDRMHEEIENIRKTAGLDIDNVFIDERAHIIMPYHMALDGAEEGKRSDKEKIGTTKRGIGPCYSDKAARMGIRAADIMDEERLTARLSLILPKKNRDLEYYGLDTVTLDDMLAKCRAWKAEFGQYIIDAAPVIREAVESGKKILLEGQLGIMRDNDWGIYPYTTSSNPTVAGGCNGAGIPPRCISKVVGVAKAYSTSVGGGPYMTELFDKDGEKLRDIGHEYGAVTGRERRCGWIDLVALKYAIMINGVTQLIMMKSDVLDGFETVKACVAYKVNGEEITEFPFEINEGIEPIYVELPGWNVDMTKMQSEDEFPEEFNAYLSFLEEELEVPIKIVSVGPDREQTIVRYEEE